MRGRVGFQLGNRVVCLGGLCIFTAALFEFKRGYGNIYLQKLRIWPHFPNKSLMENFIFYAVLIDKMRRVVFRTLSNIYVETVSQEQLRAKAV